MSQLNEIDKLIRADKLDDAEALARRITSPVSTRNSILGTIALRRGNHQEAEVFFRAALAANEQDMIAHTNLAKALIQQKKFKQALPHAKRAYEANHKVENLALLYVSCLAEVDDYPEAARVLQPYATAEKPSAAVLISYSSVLRANLQPHESLVQVKRLRELYPDRQDVLRAVADAYAELDPEKASEEFEKLSQTHDTVQIRWNRSFVELRLRNFELGWRLYDAGLEDTIGKIGRPLPAQIKPLKLVKSIEDCDPDRWTVFSSEQGLGDQVLFFGPLGEAIADRPKSILLTEERLLPIMRRSYPQLGCYPYAFGINLIQQRTAINGVLPIGCLQKTYRSTPESYLRQSAPYLKPNTFLYEKYRDIFNKRFPNERIIGISWRGGYWDRQKRTKSYDFEVFCRHLAQKGVRLISLQYGDVKEEKAAATRNNWPVTFIDGVNFIKDIDAWLALAMVCEKIVSVSTALVHGAAAMGQKVELVLSDRQSPFIWGTQPGPSIPYPTVQVHRQQAHEDPEQYLARIAESVL